MLIFSNKYFNPPQKIKTQTQNKNFQFKTMIPKAKTYLQDQTLTAITKPATQTVKQKFKTSIKISKQKR